ADGYPHRRDVVAVEAHVLRPDLDPVARARANGGVASKRQILRAVEMTRVRGSRLEPRRLEQTRIRIPHRARRRDGREVDAALVLPARAERLAERPEKQHSEHEARRDREHEQRRLTTLVARAPHASTSSKRSTSSPSAVPSTPGASRPASAMRDANFES